MNAAATTSSFPSLPIDKNLPEAERLRLAADVSAQHFEHLLGFLSYLDSNSTAMVRRAWQFADQAHRNQWRSSGDPYITHPIAVAGICANWKLDAQALSAALLHDAMEDCGITKDDLRQQFDETVAELVDGLTKLDKLHFNSREETQAESFRKMLLAMAKDVRVSSSSWPTARTTCAPWGTCRAASGGVFRLKLWRFLLLLPTVWA